MITVFERIPDFFVQLYDEQFQQWAREFRTRGQYQAIVFEPVPGRIALLDMHGQPVWKGCWLEAEVDRSQPQTPRVVIKPRTDHDAEMIERHVKEMMPHRLH
jgi:hypothetical protein